MDNQSRGALSEGAGLVWRRQRVLWWVFVVCLFLANFGAHDTLSRVIPMLDHSPAADRLLGHSFHFAAMAELGNSPADYFNPGSAPGHYTLIFFLFLLLATGGILESYWRDATLTTAEFFQSGGMYFWRFLRMVGFFLLALIPVVIIYLIFDKISDSIDHTSISPMPGVWAQFLTAVIILVVLVILRLWFDMAEVIAVAEGEVRSRRCLRLSATLLRRNFGSLFWLYFRISVIAWVFFALGLIVWSHHIHHHAVRLSLVFAQILVLFWVWARMWQRASETVWYKRYLIHLP